MVSFRSFWELETCSFSLGETGIEVVAIVLASFCELELSKFIESMARQWKETKETTTDDARFPVGKFRKPFIFSSENGVGLSQVSTNRSIVGGLEHAFLCSVLIDRVSYGFILSGYVIFEILESR